MAFTLIPLASLPWEAGAHPLEKKKTWRGRDICLLEFAVGFSDPEWCERGHVLYVVEGVLGIELAEREFSIHGGECAVLDAGTRHRAKNVGTGRVILFVVSDGSAGDNLQEK
jgi:quercetin dioxygenase-like cupin family protein